jgi:hypothetical protein
MLLRMLNFCRRLDKNRKVYSRTHLVDLDKIFRPGETRICFRIGLRDHNLGSKPSCRPLSDGFIDGIVGSALGSRSLLVRNLVRRFGV